CRPGGPSYTRGEAGPHPGALAFPVAFRRKTGCCAQAICGGVREQWRRQGMNARTFGQWLLRMLPGVAAALLAAPAAGWTDKPVRFIVPAPPGGTADAAARIVAERIAASIGQPAIGENKPGGGRAVAIHAPSR